MQPLVVVDGNIPSSCSWYKKHCLSETIPCPHQIGTHSTHNSTYITDIRNECSRYRPRNMREDPASQAGGYQLICYCFLLWTIRSPETHRKATVHAFMSLHSFHESSMSSLSVAHRLLNLRLATTATVDSARSAERLYHRCPVDCTVSSGCMIYIRLLSVMLCVRAATFHCLEIGATCVRVY